MSGKKLDQCSITYPLKKKNCCQYLTSCRFLGVNVNQNIIRYFQCNNTGFRLIDIVSYSKILYGLCAYIALPLTAYCTDRYPKATYGTWSLLIQGNNAWKQWVERDPGAIFPHEPPEKRGAGQPLAEGGWGAAWDVAGLGIKCSLLK